MAYQDVDPRPLFETVEMVFELAPMSRRPYAGPSRLKARRTSRTPISRGLAPSPRFRSPPPVASGSRRAGSSVSASRRGCGRTQPPRSLPPPGRRPRGPGPRFQTGTNVAPGPNCCRETSSRREPTEGPVPNANRESGSVSEPGSQAARRSPVTRRLQTSFERYRVRVRGVLEGLCERDKRVGEAVHDERRLHS